jgi:hypothetical protein
MVAWRKANRQAQHDFQRRRSRRESLIEERPLKLPDHKIHARLRRPLEKLLGYRYRISPPISL